MFPYKALAILQRDLPLAITCKQRQQNATDLGIEGELSGIYPKTLRVEKPWPRRPADHPSFAMNQANHVREAIVKVHS